MVFYLKIICFIFIFELNLIRFGYKNSATMNFIWKDLGMIIVVQIIWIYLKLKITPIFNLIWMKLSFSNIWINLIWFDFKFCITKNLFENKFDFFLPFYRFDLIWFSLKKSIWIGLTRPQATQTQSQKKPNHQARTGPLNLPPETKLPTATAAQNKPLMKPG